MSLDTIRAAIITEHEIAGVRHIQVEKDRTGYGTALCAFLAETGGKSVFTGGHHGPIDRLVGVMDYDGKLAHITK